MNDLLSMRTRNKRIVLLYDIDLGMSCSQSSWGLKETLWSVFDLLICMYEDN